MALRRLPGGAAGNRAGLHRNPRGAASAWTDAYSAAGVSQRDADSAVAALVRTWPRSRPASPRGSCRCRATTPVCCGSTTAPGLAFGTDGVGTKMVIAERMGRFDTIGIDCIAMNVNDLICVGAEPIALLDFLLCRAPNAELCGAIGIGLRARRRTGRDRDPRRRDRPGRRHRLRAGAHRQRRSAWSRSTRSSTAAASSPATRSSACPPRACTPTATRSRARSSLAARARRRSPRPATRRRPARADRRSTCARCSSCSPPTSTSAASPTSPATDSTTCSGSARAGRLRDRRSAARCRRSSS